MLEGEGSITRPAASYSDGDGGTEAAGAGGVGGKLTVIAFLAGASCTTGGFTAGGTAGDGKGDGTGAASAAGGVGAGRGINRTCKASRCLRSDVPHSGSDSISCHVSQINSACNTSTMPTASQRRPR